MIKSVQDLKLGMFVQLPVGWLKHSFWSNEFLITAQDDIDKIIACGLKEVKIDPRRSRPGAIAIEGVGDLPEVSEPALPPALKIDVVAIKEVLADPQLTPEKQAAQVREFAQGVMEVPLAEPSCENVVTAKKAMHPIADCIIKEDQTTDFLLKIASHDFYTSTHSINMGIIAFALAKQMYKGSPYHDLQELGAAFFLHDLGKVGIDPAILNKPGKLTPEEFSQVKTHPTRGYEILQKARELSRECEKIVLFTVGSLIVLS